MTAPKYSVRRNIAIQIAGQVGLPIETVLKIVSLTLDEIANKLVRDGEVVLKNFGTFSLRKRNQFRVWNERMGKHYDIPPAFIPRFKASRKLMRSVGEVWNPDYRKKD